MRAAACRSRRGPSAETAPACASTASNSPRPPALTRDRRAADADVGYQSATTDAAARLSRAVGGPDDPASLFSRFEAFETSLRTLADQPQETGLQRDVLSRAHDVAGAFNDINDRLLTLRADTDRAISRQVDEINRLLPEIAELNKLVARFDALGNSSAEARAERNVLIDQLSEFISFNTHVKDDGRVILTTDNGYKLVDSSAAVFEFTPATTVTSAMDLIGGAPGALDGLTLDGVDVTPNVATPPGLQQRLARKPVRSARRHDGRFPAPDRLARRRSHRSL